MVAIFQLRSFVEISRFILIEINIHIKSCGYDARESFFVCFFLAFLDLTVYITDV